MSPHLHTRSTTLTGYLELAHACGLDPQHLLAIAGIDRRALLDPEAWLPLEAVGALLEESARQADADDFGLRMAENRHPSNLGPLALVLRQEPSIRRAIVATAHYLRLHNEGAAVRCEEEGGVALIHCELARPSQQGMDLLVGVVFRTLRLLFGPDWQPRAVSFRHPAPRAMDSFRRMFGGRALFGQDFDGVVCGSAELERPPQFYDAAMAPAVRAYLDGLLAHARAGMAGKTRLWVAGALPMGDCSAEAAAAHFGIERRTLHRRLQREGASFSAIVEQTRRELAPRYLAAPGRAVAQVAQMLGFASQSVFAQWFRRAHGCSASAWRKRG